MYAYLFWLAGKRVNYALVHVENKFDVARTLGGALMCLTVPLATYQVIFLLLFAATCRVPSCSAAVVWLGLAFGVGVGCSYATTVRI